MKAKSILVLLLLIGFCVGLQGKQYEKKFDSLLTSAPIVIDSIRFKDLPFIEIGKYESVLIDSLSLQNNSSISVLGKVEIGELTIESGSISSIQSRGTCYISGNLYLRKNSTLAIEGHVEVLGSVISESNTGLIMHAGSLLQVGGNMEGAVSTHIIGSGKVSVKGFVSGGFMNSPAVNKVWPYELIHFTSTNTGTFIELKWATMSEFISKEFIIQKSADGLLFEDNFVVEAYGNVNAIQYYNMIDHEPFPGINYYRLKQINTAGRSGQSEVITSFINTELAMLRIEPKPIFQQVDIFYPQGYSQISIQLEDKQGNVLASDIEFMFPYFTINTSQIDTGIYYVAVEIDGIKEKRPVSIVN